MLPAPKTAMDVMTYACRIVWCLHSSAGTMANGKRDEEMKNGPQPVSFAVELLSVGVRQGAVFQADLVAAAEGRGAAVTHGLCAAILHADHYVVAHALALVFFHLIAGQSAADGAQCRHGFFAIAITELVAHHAAYHGATNSTDAAVIALHGHGIHGHHGAAARADRGFGLADDRALGLADFGADNRDRSSCRCLYGGDGRGRLGEGLFRLPNRDCPRGPA